MLQKCDNERLPIENRLCRINKNMASVAGKKKQNAAVYILFMDLADVT